MRLRNILVAEAVVPLHDHFHRPSGSFRQWNSFHSTWCVKMMERLNEQVLPVRYRAAPHIHLGIHGQVDVAAVRKEEEELRAQAANGAVATAMWAPPKPPIVLTTDFTDLDVIEIEVVDDEEGFRLVAAIELISPANKNRPSHRQAFAAKCAAYLQKEVSVIVVDVVTERQNSLHLELMDLLELSADPKSALASDLYAVAYRPVNKEHGGPHLEMWPEPLQLGTPLPVLPLWIAPDLTVPLDLEASYAAACDSLRLS